MGPSKAPDHWHNQSLIQVENIFSNSSAKYGFQSLPFEVLRSCRTYPTELSSGKQNLALMDHLRSWESNRCHSTTGGMSAGQVIHHVITLEFGRAMNTNSSEAPSLTASRERYFNCSILLKLAELWWELPGLKMLNFSKVESSTLFWSSSPNLNILFIKTKDSIKLYTSSRSEYKSSPRGLWVVTHNDLEALQLIRENCEAF